MRKLLFHLRHPLTKRKQRVFFNQNWLEITTYRIFGITVDEEVKKISLFN